jgi:DNA-binding beta-propeller fold protein YncE
VSLKSSAGTFCMALVLLPGLVSCTSAPRVMSYFPEQDPADLGWPGAPEVRRLQYAGQLVGEVNFSVDPSGPQDGAGVKLLKWIAGLGGDQGQSRRLLRPQTGVVDPLGRVLVTDVGRQGVVVFDPVAGTLQVWQQATPARRFDTPVGIAINLAGEVLVADSGLGMIVRLDMDGRPRGYLDTGSLERPTGLAVDPRSGEVFVADSARHDIKVFAVDGTLERVLGHRGEAPGEFNGPTHLSIQGGRLYVADTLNARVQVLEADGRPVAQVGKRGLYLGNMVRPKGVAVDSAGNLYVVESEYDHLLVFDRHGRFLLPLGGNGQAIGQFFLPSGAWTDGKDRIFVADMFNGRVMVFQYLGDGA